MKYIITSTLTQKKYLIDTEADELQKLLYEVISSDTKNQFSVKTFQKDTDNEEIWKIYMDILNKV